MTSVEIRSSFDFVSWLFKALKSKPMSVGDQSFSD